MEENDLKRLLHSGAREPAGRGWRCPDAVRFADYARHRLSAAECAKFEAHVADCPACLDQLTFLVRQPAASHDPVDPRLLSRAVDLVPERSRLWPAVVPRWAGVAVATICFLLVVTIELRQPGVPPQPGSSPAPVGTPSQGATPAPAPVAPAPAPAPASSQSNAAPREPVRKSAPRPLALRLLTPLENATLSASEPEFRWQPVSGTVFYEVQVLSEEGDVVWHTRVESTAARLPTNHSLHAGTRYFVWVRAHLSSGGSVRSAAVSFRVAGS